MSNPAVKSMRLRVTLVVPLLLIEGSSYARELVSQRPATLIAQTRLDRSFTPWCAKYSYFCVSRSDARSSRAGTFFDLRQREQFARGLPRAIVTEASLQGN
jgi:hypothetical protein